ncbi:mutS protein homolog 5 isoform X1 [Phlebotomus argentipes]|uniref:mutS protein homolog 5 isoform X1 n=1 Tax=Phlebotomus argentipes TaxID=94469 RepID=UPI002892A442|nr:mutS protein homolog 5 isoform X1 [Phlebotomus argentipes]
MNSNDAIENTSFVNEDLSEEYEHLISLCWDSGNMSATFITLQTMEMFVVPEITDLRPMFSYTHNLFRQLNPIVVLASGHESFLREIMTLLKLPEEADPKDYVSAANQSGRNNFVVFPQSEKSVGQNRQRLWNINLSGFHSEVEKQSYLKTQIPPHQKLVIQSAGNLLKYMETNWKSISPQDNTNMPIITSLKVFSLKSQVLIDDSSYLALEIFNTAPHPSGFKKGLKGTEQTGFSLYRLLNHCQSKIGCDEMKMIFQQPTNEISVLNKRFETIEWCMSAQNAGTVERLRKMLRHVYEISRCFRKILENPNKMYFWKIFRTSITNAFHVAELCRDSTQPGEKCGVVGDLRDAIESQVDIMVVFMAINEIIDFDEGVAQNKFTVHMGFDAELDKLKEYFKRIQADVPDDTKEEIRRLFPAYDSCEFTLVPEMGFVVSIKSPLNSPVSIDSSSASAANGGFKFLYKTEGYYYYSAPYCVEMNTKYGHIHHDICLKEQEICSELINSMAKNIGKLLNIVKYCAQLDCFMAFAAVAATRKYVRPQMSQDKVVKIEAGRHALQEECDNFIPNDIHVAESRENLITIITAPNSAGKSIYLKQVGIIVYLAHIGCYVPAASAHIGTIDSIYSRIHSTEAMHQGASSFLYDLQQMGKVMINSSSRCLILIDEFGTGTNVNEGKSLLVACIEDLSRRGKSAPIALFSTHYMDVVDLCESREMVKEITIKSYFDDNGRLQTTYKIVDGRCPLQYANELHNIRRSEEGLRVFTDDRLKMIQDTMKSTGQPDAAKLVKNKTVCAFEVMKTYLASNRNIDETIKKFYEYEIE